MSTESCQIIVAGLRVDVVRKPIKNLHLGVYPPNGRIRVAAPIALSEDAVRLAVVVRMSWIKSQRKRFDRQARQSLRSFISGETHYLLGQRYRLNLIVSDDAEGVRIRNGRKLDLHVRPGSDQETRKRVFLRWCRRELRRRAVPLVERKALEMGLPMPAMGIKRMKTKWGTCSVGAGRIWLNLELIKKPQECLEYIVVHELAHFIQRNHSEKFVALLDRFQPHWRLAREELTSQPLAHEDWGVQAAHSNT